MEGTAFRNFDFIFCDFIKHPIANITNDNINNTTNTIRETLNITNRVEDTMFSR